MIVKWTFLVVTVACWFVVIAGIAAPITCPTASETDLGRGPSRALAQTSYTPHAPIVISSDQDFADQGWSGSGSKLNPFILEGFVFDTLLNGACVNISNTRAWFILRDCLFNLTDMSVGTVSLLNVTRGTVVLCVFQGGVTAVLATDCDMMHFELLQCSDAGVMCTRCYNSTIYGCGIYFVPGDGISLDTSSWITLNGNTIGYCAANGIFMLDCHDSEIFDNTILYNSMVQIWLETGCSYNTIFDNNIIRESLGGCAVDNGQSNAWDAGVGHGNSWSDYSGSGYYYIPGTASAVDHYPKGVATTTTITTTTTSTTTAVTTTTTTTTTTTSTTIVTTTNTSSVVSSFGLDFWTPMAVPDRIVLVALVIASAVLIAVAALVLLRKGKFV